MLCTLPPCMANNLCRSMIETNLPGCDCLSASCSGSWTVLMLMMSFRPMRSTMIEVHRHEIIFITVIISASSITTIMLISSFSPLTPTIS